MAFYADKDYTEDQSALKAANQVMQGNLTLFWYDARTEHLKGRPADPRRGLTMDDINLGSYGYTDLPEHVRNSQSMAARGSEKWGKLVDMGYVVNRKSDVWSDNVSQLYEESKARRWAPAVDIPWSAIEQAQLKPVIQAACAQIYTFMQECALVSMDFPARWVPLINQDFTEQKSFLCAQMLDGSRLLEAFRKRALYGGTGLGRASVSAEQGLKEWLWADSYPTGSLSVNLSLGGFMLALYRQIAAFAPCKADRAIMGYAMQDAGRQVAYGFGQLRYHLRHQPGKANALHEYLNDSEHVMAGLLASTEMIEPLIIICGGGLEKDDVKKGSEAVRKFIRLVVREYLERLEAGGLDGRAQQSKLPGVIAQLGA